MVTLKSLALRIGFRGGFLFFLSASYLFHGWFLIAGKHGATIPIGGDSLWGLIFTAASVFMVTGVLARNDRYQYAAAVFVLFLWSLEYFWRSVYVPYAWSTGLMWLFMSVVVALVSTWPEPLRVQVKRKVSEA
jgi:hypothetical protein